MQNFPWSVCHRTDSRAPGVQHDSPQVAAKTVKGVSAMLETIAIVLILLWALGLVSSYSMGGLIHILLVVAVVLVLLRLIRGRSL